MVNNVVHGMGIIGIFTPNLDPSILVPKKIVSTESLFRIGRTKNKDHKKARNGSYPWSFKIWKMSFAKKLIFFCFSRVLIGF